MRLHRTALPWTLFLALGAAPCPAAPAPGAPTAASKVALAAAARDSAANRPFFPYRMPAVWIRHGPTISRADTMQQRGDHAGAGRFLDSLVAVARARDDRDLLLQALIRRGGGFAFRGNVTKGEPDLIEAYALATARRDTLGMIKSLQWRAFAYNVLSKYDVSVPLWRRMLTLAQATREADHIGWAIMGLAFAHSRQGQQARALGEYRRSWALLEKAGDGPGTLQARSSAAVLAQEMGRPAEAEAEYRKLIVEARRANLPYVEAVAFHNLGVIEFSHGDPARSVEYWRRCLVLEDRLGMRQTAPGPTYALAVALTYLGRAEEAAPSLERLRTEAFATHDLVGWAMTQNQLAIVRRMQGRDAESERLLREVMARADSVPAEFGLNAEHQLAIVLQRRGRLPEALALLEPRRGDAARDAYHATLRAELLVALDRPRDALVLLGRGESADDDWESLAGHERARAYRKLHEPDSAYAAMLATMRFVETGRRRMGSFDWREARGRSAGVLYAEYARTILDAPSLGTPAARRRLAFDALQPFKARTLEERMRGPSALDSTARARATPLTLATLQRSVLRDGELLLDYFLGNDESFLFAVTRTGFQLVELPSADVIWERSDRFSRSLSGSVDPAVRAAAARSLADLLLGDARGLVAANRRVIVSADGIVATAPFAMLPVGEAGRPLIEDRELALAPSATLLAAIRSRRAPAPAHKLLAIAGARGGSGEKLEGAMSETRWLERTYAGVTTRTAGRAESAAGAARDLGAYEVLHLAAHTSVDGNNPWNSGILLGTGEGADAYLRAADISRRRLGTRLCVVSGCSSVGSLQTIGEGVLGLSAAFMSAGVPSVLATLWPIEDATAERFVREFYRALAGGGTAAGALREAQNALRAGSGTRDPRDWAGFVLIGEPDTRVALRRRPLALPLLTKP